VGNQLPQRDSRYADIHRSNFGQLLQWMKEGESIEVTNSLKMPPIQEAKSESPLRRSHSKASDKRRNRIRKWFEPMLGYESSEVIHTTKKLTRQDSKACNQVQMSNPKGNGNH
jgi:hypothetical protein